jgi:hypothetical protein
MLFLIVSIVLLLTGGSLGRALGGVRMAISLVGVILGGILAFKVGPGLHDSFVKLGVGQIWSYILPPAGIFVGVLMLFNSVAQFAHHKVSYHYRYKAHDDDRVMWERLNDQLGLCLGLFNGVCYVIVFGLTVYVAGYLTLQVKSPKSNPKTLTILNALRESMRYSYLEKTIAAFDPIPVTYYQFADLLGLVYNNPDVGRRLETYPMLMGWAEDPEIQALAADAQFTALLTAREPIGLILKHPKVQLLLKNERFLQMVRGLDLADLNSYIETGTSTKFKDERLLGRWELYVPATLNQIKSKNPQLKVSELALLKRSMNSLADDLTLVASADGQLFLKSKLADGKPFIDLMSGRVPGASPTNATGHHVVMPGSWKKVDKDYVLTFKGPTGDQSEGASIKQNEKIEVLTTSFYGGGLVMMRVD